MVQHLLDVTPIKIDFEGDGAERVANDMAGEAYREDQGGQSEYGCEK